MSEFVHEEDPEPLSGGLQEFINTSIIDTGRYSDDGLAAHYRELEQQRQERLDIGALCVQAETLFRLYESSGDADDKTIERGDVTLRRRYEKHLERDRPPITTILYFFNDNRDKEGYCRVWTNASNQINWCYNEQRHEPAADVQAHLHEAFPPAQMRMTPRKFGKLALPRILRQKV